MSTINGRNAPWYFSDWNADWAISNNRQGAHGDVDVIKRFKVCGADHHTRVTVHLLMRTYSSSIIRITSNLPESIGQKSQSCQNTDEMMTARILGWAIERVEDPVTYGDTTFSLCVKHHPSCIIETGETIVNVHANRRKAPFVENHSNHSSRVTPLPMWSLKMSEIM